MKKQVLGILLTGSILAGSVWTGYGPLGAAAVLAESEESAKDENTGENEFTGNCKTGERGWSCRYIYDKECG